MKMKDKYDTRTPDLFEATHTWNLVLNAYALDGTMARLQEKCSSSTSVFLLLRAGCDWDSGLVSMGTTFLAQKAGCSRGSVSNAIKALADEGLIEIIGAAKGKRPVYRLYDRVDVRQGGEDAGRMMIPYKPRHVTARVEDIQRFRKTGELPERAMAAGVNLNITINITKIENAENVYTFTDETSKGLAQIAEMSDGPWKSLALRKLKEKIDELESQVEEGNSMEGKIGMLRDAFTPGTKKKSTPEA